MLAFALATSGAHAFCGTFVGAAGSSLVNNSSEVVLARSGDTTTLTLIMDYEGDATDFALLLPVPEVLDASDVGSVDDELLEWISAYSQPRAVEYSCDDAFASTLTGSGCGTAIGCSMSGTDAEGEGVGVEGAFTAYGYDFVVLSAEESAGLEQWLADNGYAIPEGGQDILQEYIDGGSYFLAAKVALEETPTSGEPVWLPPIRLTYESDVFSLPIRIGTISADGPQEVVVYALTDAQTGGEVGIANYEQIEMPTECMWPADETLEDWYAQAVDARLEEHGAGWIREYSWTLKPEVSGSYHCDPCTAEAIAPGGSFAPFGLQAVAAHLTRLRVRYTPETALEDLVLYESGVVDVEDQLKFVTYKKDLEFLFPDCDAGWAEDPGTCPDAPMFSCGTPGMRGSAAALMAAALLVRRRRAA